MPEKAEVRHTLSEQQARQLATVTKTVPMMEVITPRWLVTFPRRGVVRIPPGSGTGGTRGRQASTRPPARPA